MRNLTFYTKKSIVLSTVYYQNKGLHYGLIGEKLRRFGSSVIAYVHPINNKWELVLKYELSDNGINKLVSMIEGELDGLLDEQLNK